MNQIPPPGAAGQLVPPGSGPVSYGPPGPGQASYGRPGSGLPPWLLPEPPSPSGIPLRPMSVSEILNGSITLVRRSPGGTLGLCLITMTAAAVISALGGFLAYRVNNPLIILPTVLLVWPLSAVMFATVTVVASRGFFGVKIGIWRALPLARLGWALLTVIPIGIGFGTVWFVMIASGVPFLVLPLLPLSAWLGVMFSMSVPVAVLERVAPHRAWGRSWRLVQGHFWRTLGLYLLLGVIAYFVYTAMVVPLELLFGVIGLPILNSHPNSWHAVVIVAVVIFAVFLILIYSVVAAITICSVTLVFADLRMRKEGFDLMISQAAGSAPTGDEFAWTLQSPAPAPAPARDRA